MLHKPNLAPEVSHLLLRLVGIVFQVRNALHKFLNLRPYLPGSVVALALLASYNFVNRSTTETVADVPVKKILGQLGAVHACHICHGSENSAASVSACVTDAGDVTDACPG
jgi:hypothetical protein